MVLRLRRSYVLRGSIPGQFMSFVSFWAYLKHGYVLSGSSVSMCCVILVYQAVYACGFWYTLGSHSGRSTAESRPDTYPRTAVRFILHGVPTNVIDVFFSVQLY